MNYVICSSIVFMTIEESITKYEAYLRTVKRLAEGTVKNYVTDLRGLEEWLTEAGVTEVGEISARDIRGWQMAQMEAGIGEGTMRRKLSSLRPWFRYMRNMKWVEGDVMIKVKSPKVPKRLPVFFKESETERLYEDGMFEEGYEGERDKLILRMLYETGMRRSELAGLNIGSIDFGGKRIKVLGKGNKERFIPVEEELLGNIERYLALKEETYPGAEALFLKGKGVAINANDVYRIVKKYMCLLSNAERISPHVFRHTFATHMLNEGANIDAIKELLGHANLNATEIYTHNTREHLKEAYKHAHPRGDK